MTEGELMLHPMLNAMPLALVVIAFRHIFGTLLKANGEDAKTIQWSCPLG